MNDHDGTSLATALRGTYDAVLRRRGGEGTARRRLPFASASDVYDALLAAMVMARARGGTPPT